MRERKGEGDRQGERYILELHMVFSRNTRNPIIYKSRDGVGRIGGKVGVDM